MNRTKEKNIRIHSGAITDFMSKKPSLLLRIGPTLILAILLVLGIHWSLRDNYKIQCSVFKSGRSSSNLEIFINNSDFDKVADIASIEVITEEQNLIFRAKIINYSIQRDRMVLFIKTLNDEGISTLPKNISLNGFIIPKSKLTLIIENIKASFNKG